MIDTLSKIKSFVNPPCLTCPDTMNSVIMESLGLVFNGSLPTVEPFALSVPALPAPSSPPCIEMDGWKYPCGGRPGGNGRPFPPPTRLDSPTSPPEPADLVKFCSVCGEYHSDSLERCEACRLTLCRQCFMMPECTVDHKDSPHHYNIRDSDFWPGLTDSTKVEADSSLIAAGQPPTSQPKTDTATTSVEQNCVVGYSQRLLVKRGDIWHG